MSNYHISSAKLQRFIDYFIREEVAILLDRLNSSNMEALIKVIKDYTTVRRDREYYGTTLRHEDRITLFKDLQPDLTQKHQVVLDSLKETVYREAYFDVLVEIRELKNLCDELLSEEQAYTEDNVDNLWLRVTHLEESLGMIPLPKAIYVRVESEAKTSAMASLKR